jgi:hypothetical protein
MAVRFDFDAPLARWAFVRGAEQLVMDHVATGAIVIAFSGAAPQVIRFEDPTEAVFFQCNIETEMERTGWTLAVFELRVTEARQPVPLSR